MSETDELVTCGYDTWPHVCEHWIDDAEYHEGRNEPPCMSDLGVEWKVSR